MEKTKIKYSQINAEEICEHILPKYLDEMRQDASEEGEPLSEDVERVVSAVARKRLDVSLARVRELSESPIETELGSALIIGMFCSDPGLVCVPTTADEKDYDEAERAAVYAVQNTQLWLMPNLWIDKKTRVDFALLENEGRDHKAEPKFTVIECDGFKWHHTPEAFTKDRSRERRIVAAGHRVVRFSGKEILEDPTACVKEIIKLFTPGYPCPPPSPLSRSRTLSSPSQRVSTTSRRKRTKSS